MLTELLWNHDVPQYNIHGFLWPAITHCIYFFVLTPIITSVNLTVSCIKRTRSTPLQTKTRKSEMQMKGLMINGAESLPDTTEPAQNAKDTKQGKERTGWPLTQKAVDIWKERCKIIEAAVYNEQKWSTSYRSGKCHITNNMLVYDKQGNLLTTAKEQKICRTEHFQTTLTSKSIYKQMRRSSPPWRTPKQPECQTV